MTYPSPGEVERSDDLVTRTPCNCEHPDADHVRVTSCSEEIHYPSEDYPCLCQEIVANGETCAGCGHEVVRHLVKQVCRSCDCALKVR